MNFPNVDAIIGRQRCRQWTPLITQQLRLRHLYQITAFNIISDKQGKFYFTLHLATLSSPFYTSEKINSPNPKWGELEFSLNTPLSVSGVVIRIWQQEGNAEKDKIISTWGVNFSGLVFLGSKLSEIQPTYFKDNSVIFHMRGGYFTSHKTLKIDFQKPLPFIDHLNLLSTDEDTKVCKNTGVAVASNEIRKSYNSAKLRRLHSLQIALKNKAVDAQLLREKIEAKCGLDDVNEENASSPVSVPTVSSEPPVRYATQLLTMNSLNKMLQETPTKGQRKEIVKVKKAIEVARWRTKLLSKERNQKTQQIRQLKQKYTTIYEQNEERESQLMDNYRSLSKDVEKLREWRKEQLQQREDLLHYSSQLHHRRRQLISQLLEIYPIREIEPNKFCINGVYLPDSDLLTDCSDAGLSVALGYVSHILTMCASFLQVPLRYPVVHLGSRSYIIDHITPVLINEKDKEFPLYTKGKDRMQFNYAVYLLNKNISQLRLLCGLQTPDLRMTLPNLLTFLQGKDNNVGPALYNKLEVLSQKLKQEEPDNRKLSFKGGGNSLSSSPVMADPILDEVRRQCNLERAYTPIKKLEKKISSAKDEEGGPGLGEILAIPEAYLNKQISCAAFRTYMSSTSSKMSSSSEFTDTVPHSKSSKSSTKSTNTAIKNFNSNCDIQVKTSTTISRILPGEVIEQGTDPLDPNQTEKDPEKIEVYTEQPVLRNMPNKMDIITRQKRKSRSVGSYTEESLLDGLKTGLEIGSDPVINKSTDATDAGLPKSLEDQQSEFLQKWLDSNPALVCSEENLYPEEILGFSQENGENPLTVRTDALLNTTSFNLVKPKL